MSDPVLVVGAGPTGLTLAIELLRFGVPVRLIDKSDHAAKYSQALVVQARTLEQFDRYGIADRAVAAGRPIRVAKFWSEKKLVAEIQLSRIPSRFAYGLVLPQNDTEDLLIEHLKSLGGKVERHIELTGFENGEAGVTASLKHSDGRTEQVPFRWIVGCDGAHSTVRRTLNVPFEGDTVPMKFSLGDLHLKGEDVPCDELALFWHHGGDVLFIAKLRGDLYRIIVISRAEGRQEEDHHTPTVDEFNQTFARFYVKMTALSSEWSAPFHVNERKASHYRKQSAFLAGDASHIHSPAGGQGMNTGIQDAANLAWKLAAVANGADEKLLDSYNQERGAIGQAVLRNSGFGLRMATAEGSIAEHVRNFVMHHALQLGFVQDAATKIVSEIGIAYRDSSIVTDDAHSGPLRAGDRLPDADGPSGSLYSELRDAKHLLLAVDVPAGDVPRDLKHTKVVELQSSAVDWAPSLSAALGQGPLLYLVRPDGYIGFRGTGDSKALRSYAQRLGLL